MRSTCPKEGHKFVLDYLYLLVTKILEYFLMVLAGAFIIFFFNWYFEKVDVWYFYRGLIYWIRSADVFFIDENYILLKKKPNSYRLEYVDYIYN